MFVRTWLILSVESKSVNIISPTQSPPKSRGTSSSQKYVNGPALRVGGVSAVWEKDDTSRVEEIGASCRVIFDGNQGDQVTSWLEVINYGSTVVRFNWTVETSLLLWFFLVKGRPLDLFWYLIAEIRVPNEWMRLQND